MDVTCKPNRDPDGFVVFFEDGVFRTHRYILPQQVGFVTVNPFGCAEDCPMYDSFDEALDGLTKEVALSRRSSV